MCIRSGEGKQGRAAGGGVGVTFQIHRSSYITSLGRGESGLKATCRATHANTVSVFSNYFKKTSYLTWFITVYGCQTTLKGT